MFDYDYCISLIHKFLQYVHQYLDVLGVQTCGGLVEYVESVPGRASEQFRGKFHPLAFPTRKCHGRLAEADIAQTHVNQRLELGRDLRHAAEEFIGLAYRHIQYIVDVPALVADFQRVFLVAAAAAFFAYGIDRRQEVHLYDLDSGALAFLAASSCDVEGETAGAEATDFRVYGVGEKVAYVVEYPGEGRRVAARGTSYRTLVDFDEFVYVLDSQYLVVWERGEAGAVEAVLEHRHQGLVDE